MNIAVCLFVCVLFNLFVCLQDGYFGLTSDNPNGCKECNCDSAGSVNISCTSSGNCYCRPKFSGQKCEIIADGFFVPSVGALTYEAEETELSPVSVIEINETIE